MNTLSNCLLYVYVSIPSSVLPIPWSRKRLSAVGSGDPGLVKGWRIRVCLVLSLKWNFSVNHARFTDITEEELGRL